MNGTTKKHDLVIRRVLNAPVEQVWQAWSDPDLMKQWWGPEGFTVPLAKLDFREGGTSLVSMSAPEFGEQFSTFAYQKIVPLERIEYIHNLTDKEGNPVDPTAMGMPPDFPQNQRHAVTFKPLGEDKTELTITEYGWTVGQMMEMSEMGMNQCLDKMARALSDSPS